MSDDLPWWARPGAHDDPAGAEAPTEPLAPAPEPASDVLPGERVMCVGCSLPARWVAGGRTEHEQVAAEVTGECVRSGHGHGPWIPRAEASDVGGALLDAMRRSGGGPHGSW